MMTITGSLLSDSKTARRRFGSLIPTYVEGSFVHTEKAVHAVGVDGATLYIRATNVPDN